MNNKRLLKITLFSFFINTAYGIANVAFGVFEESGWLFATGVYYLFLSVMRIAALTSRDKQSSVFVRKFTAVMLMMLSVVLVFIVILSSIKDRGTKYHEIIMITMAVYAFTKITVAIINIVKSGKSRFVVTKTLRSISLADAAVSIFALQRSMLVSFGEMKALDIRTFNIATGSAVCVFVCLVGLNLLFSKSTYY